MSEHSQHVNCAKDFAVAALCAFALAGCGGGNQVPGPLICNLPFIPSVQMLYPEPGATSVPDNSTALVYSSSKGFPIVIETMGASKTVAQPTAVPSPLPSPAATPLPGFTATDFAVRLPTLSHATTYSVVAILSVTPGVCAPTGQIDIPMGSFSTK